MYKNFRDKIALSGVTVLMIGVALLIFTFISAYGFLTESFFIIASQDLMQTFGNALGPLIAACIHVMYLGVMGWIGSLITIRGVTIIAHAPKVSRIPVQRKVIARPEPQKMKAEKSKEEAKPQEPKIEKPREEIERKEETRHHEPEILVIPPEMDSQAQPPPNQEERSSEQSSGP